MMLVETKRKAWGYSEPYGKNKILNTKPKSLYEHFVPSGTKVKSSDPIHSEVGQRQPQKKDKISCSDITRLLCGWSMIEYLQVYRFYPVINIDPQGL